MYLGRSATLLFVGLVLGTSSAVAPAAEAAGAADEQILKTASVGTDGSALLEFLKQRTLANADRERILALIRALGDDDFSARERASGQLVKLGNAAVPLLNQAVHDPDSEVARRAARSLERINSMVGPAVSAAVVRLIAERKPARAVEALLAYLPFADDEGVEEEVRRALAVLAVPGGKPEPALVRSLADPLARRRGVAAEALARAGEIARVRGLLKDPDPTVRLRLALALAEHKEEEAYPALIRLLVDLPQARAWQAETALRDLACESAPEVALGKDDASRAKCRAAWESWWQAQAGPALLETFRKGTLSEVDRARVPVLVAQLAERDPNLRQNASAALIRLGRPAMAPIRRALKDAKGDAIHRGEECVTRIQQGPGQSVSASSARLVAVRKPAGAAGVLLAYLPCAEEDVVEEEARWALAAVAVRDGKPEAAVVRALTDREPVRRAAAAEALCRSGDTRQRPAVLGLLKDADPSVRLRVALALAEHQDKQAVPTLIALLGQLPPDLRCSAEEVLMRLAGDRAPVQPATGDAAADRRYVEAWQSWWQQYGNQVDVAALQGVPRLHGFTLIAQWDGGQVGRITELGPDGKTRWEVLNLPWPLEFELLPGKRLLLAEYYSNRVTERNYKGELLWEKGLDQSPILAQRLPNGNTFMATQARMVEVDRAGKEVFSYSPPGGMLVVRKLKSGRIACITTAQRYQELDAGGKELKSFAVSNVNNYCAMDVLPNGRVLVPQQTTNKVVEYSPEGKVIWEASVQQPTAVSRLPNGNTLVACRDTQQVLELNRNGKVVWERKITTGYPWRIRRR